MEPEARNRMSEYSYCKRRQQQELKLAAESDSVRVQRKHLEAAHRYGLKATTIVAENFRDHEAD